MYNPNNVPDNVHNSLHRYVIDGVPTGGFLRAVLENDLFTAVFKADPVSLAALKDIVGYVHNNVPASCHGSKEAVRQWLAKKGV